LDNSQDLQVDLRQIFQEDGKWAAIEKLSFLFLNSFRDGREVQKGHFFSSPSWTQLHEIKHGDKLDLIVKKRKLSDFGQIISLPNAENVGKIRQRTDKILWWSYSIFRRRGIDKLTEKDWVRFFY